MSSGKTIVFEAKFELINQNIPTLIYTIDMVLQLSHKSQQHISKKLKEIRRERNLSQEEVAQKSGISTTYYAGIERGEENPSMAVMEAICKTLRVKSSEIIPI